MLSASVGFTIAMPGLVLLNQEHDWIPVNGRIFDVQIDGESVPVETVVWDSIIAGSAWYSWSATWLRRFAELATQPIFAKFPTHLGLGIDLIFLRSQRR
jgi:hypothetical protein